MGIGVGADEVLSADAEAAVETIGAVEEAEEAGSFAYATWMSLLPPLIAIILALITKEVYSSLFIGILAGGLLATNFSLSGTLEAVTNDGFVASVSGSAGIFIFLVLLGVLVALLNRTGASAAFGKWASKNIKSRTGAALATFALGVLIFIDDYFNCLTVGSVMQPVTDANKISRAKLSFIIDATAAPICMIAPISSWAAAVSLYVEGTGYDGFDLFIKAIPYNFYSLLTLVFVVALAIMKFDYGPMAVHEKNAIEKGDLFTSGTEHAAENKIAENDKVRVFDLIIPIITLIIVVVFALIYMGEFFSGASFVDAFANTDVTVGLPLGGILALVVAIVYLLCRRVITFKAAMECIPEGFKAMVPAIIILTMAGALKNMTVSLGSDAFVKSFMADAGALQNFLPAIIFLVACFIAFSTGTSWGTFGILIPIVISIFPESQMLYIGVSACLAGAVCGDHCSPISDTTIMSSAGARCDHINHVSTQLPYAVTVAAVSFVSYIIAAFIQNWLIALLIAIVLMILTLFVIKAITKKKA
ncbi:MAG: Na+/H+ antiporter NhaC family protein [Ruminococcaceae bacterium]|nr:Na+/H+ antiporter NhaC family protein [Oscillospiraceae bacterium]